MARYGPSQRGNYGRYFTHSGRRVKQTRSSQGQGAMNAFYSGSSQLVRHSVPQSLLFPTGSPGILEDQKLSQCL